MPEARKPPSPSDQQNASTLAAADALVRWRPLDTLSVGGWTILTIAVISSVMLAVWPDNKRSGLSLWVFSVDHAVLYEPLLEERNRLAAEDPAMIEVHNTTLDPVAMVRRLLAGFWGDTPLPDLVEIETAMMSRFTSGPLESMGMVDLTDRILAEGLDERINLPSFSPWTSRGRIFGLPHDVHPTLLAYRADIVEAAGIDVNAIETWEDFEREMQPLLEQKDESGRPLHYPLAMWYSDVVAVESLLLQAGGGVFDPNGQPALDHPANAEVVARVATWCLGENRIAVDAPRFSFAGDQLKSQGRVVAEIMPDWLAGVWKRTLPQLGGKMKLMPLPAWEPGGRRTSVLGGTMLGIPKRTLTSRGDGTGDPSFETAWAFAKELYLDRDYAERLFRQTNIVTPVKDYWDEPYFHEPDPYFSNQQSGSLFLRYAPDVPLRNPSPLASAARQRLTEVLGEVYRKGRDEGIDDVDLLRPFALERLKEAQARVLDEMSRNAFLSNSEPSEPSESEESEEVSLGQNHGLDRASASTSDEKEAL